MRAVPRTRRSRPAPSPASPRSTPAAWDRAGPGRQPVPAPRLPGRAGGQRLGQRADRLAAVPPRGRGGGRLVGRGPALRQEPLLRRVRVRPWLGRGLSPRRRQLLPQAAGGGAVHAGARARACWPRATARARRLIEGLQAATRQLGLSSLHVTFCTADEAAALGAAGFLLRRGIQFHWQNQGYASFEAWLDSAQERQAQDGAQGARAGARRRRRPSRRCTATRSTPALLDEFFPFYLATVDKRWGNAYLSRDFFRRLGSDLTRPHRARWWPATRARMVGRGPEPARQRTRSTAGNGAASRSSSSSTSRPATIRRSSSRSATACSGSRPARRASTSCTAATPRSGPTAPT